MDAEYDCYGKMLLGEDLFQLLPVFDNAGSFGVLDEPLYMYHDNNPGQITSIYRPCYLDNVITVNTRLLYYGDKWGDSCQKAAHKGVLLNYIYLLKLCEKSSEPICEKEQVFSTIRTLINSDYRFSEIVLLGLRPDYFVIIILIMRGHYATCARLLSAIELIKHWQR